MPAKSKKMTIEIDAATGDATVSGGKKIPFGDLELVEKIPGANVRHKVLSISDNAVIRTNPGCYWIVINGVLYQICP